MRAARFLLGLTRGLIGWMVRLSLMLLVLAATAVGVLLGTPDGIGWLLTKAQPYIPGRLAVERIEGGLFGDLQLQGLRYRDASLAVEIGTLILVWEPRELLRRRLHLVELKVADGRFEQLAPGEAEPESDQPFRLPDIELPVVIRIDRLGVEGFQVVTAPGAEPVVIDRVLLQAEADGSEVVLKNLELALPEIDLEASGRARLAGKYPLTLHNELRLRMTDIPKLDLRGDLSGDLERLVIGQVLGGALDARLDAQADDLLGALAWRTKLILSRVGLEWEQLTGVPLPPGLHAEVNAKGDLQQAELALQVDIPAASAAPDPAVTNSDTAIPEQAEAVPPPPGSLELTGSATFAPPDGAPPSFQAEGRWQALQWPLTGAALVKMESGTVRLTGSMERWRFGLDAKVTGPDLPPGTWTLRGSGDAQRARIDRLHADILGGTLDLEGRVAWAPVPQWQVTLAAADLDPGHVAAEWPGKLGLALRSSGKVEQDRPRLEVVVERLEGTLRELPLSGGGSFRMNGNEMLLDAVRIASGSAKLSADGKLGSRSDLIWRVEIPNLGHLLPHARGHIQGNGKLLGDLAAPKLDARLGADGVELESLVLDRLAADVALDLTQGGAARIDLDAARLGDPDDPVRELHLSVDGPFDAQRIRLAAEHSMATARLDAEGALDLAKGAWRGSLEHLTLELADWGDWRLRSPVPLQASAERAKLDPLCLRSGKAELCAELDWQPAGGNARVAVRGFSLERLSPLLPAEVTALSGSVDADVRAKLGQPPEAVVKVSLDPGRVVYLVDEARQIELSHRGGAVNAVLGARQLTAKLHLEVGSSGLDGEARMPRAGLEGNPLTAPLKGHLKFDFKEMGLIGAFVPAIQESQGEIEGRLTLAGSVGDPRVAGRIALNMSKLSVPEAGLDLKDLKATVQGDGGQRLSIGGGVASGPGRIDLGGEVQLDASRGWPARLTIEGDRFRAVDLDQAKVFISPDLRIEHSDKGLKVRGEVEVPEAHIHLKEIPDSARSVSSDLVIVEDGDDEEALQTGAPIDLKVTVALGKKVSFRGFGVLAQLGGRITVSEEPGRPPVAHGDLGIVHGSVRSFGQELTIERGKVFYAGGSLTNPGLNIRASREVGDLTAGVDIFGTAKRPVFKAFSSDPIMTEDDARSLLLTGYTKSQAAQGKANVYAGTNLTDRLSVGTNISVDSHEKEYVARYRLTRKWSVKTSSSSTTSGAELLYTIKFE